MLHGVVVEGVELRVAQRRRAEPVDDAVAFEDELFDHRFDLGVEGGVRIAVVENADLLGPERAVHRRAGGERRAGACRAIHPADPDHRRGVVDGDHLAAEHRGHAR